MILKGYEGVLRVMKIFYIWRYSGNNFKLGDFKLGEKINL